MSKYIRTKDGRLFEYAGRERTPYGDIISTNGTHYRYDCVLKEADTIKELCDEFVVLEYGIESGVLYSRSQYITLEDAIASQTSTHKCSYEIYGAIWKTGKKGEPILESVAQMNEKEDLELLAD